MLELRPNCENCNKALPNGSDEAMICTFECTYCHSCVEEILHNVCPNCGGGFEKRPTRPQQILTKYPVSTRQVLKPVDMEQFQKLLNQYKEVKPEKR